MLGHECPGASGGGMSEQWPPAGLGALSAAVPAWDHLRRSPLSSLLPPWSQVNNRDGTQFHPSTENWIKDLLSTAPHHQNKPQFAPQSVSPIRKLQ